jgi:hypothetical protein
VLHPQEVQQQSQRRLQLQLRLLTRSLHL